MFLCVYMNYILYNLLEYGQQTHDDSTYHEETSGLSNFFTHESSSKGYVHQNLDNVYKAPFHKLPIDYIPPATQVVKLHYEKYSPKAEFNPPFENYDKLEQILEDIIPIIKDVKQKKEYEIEYEGQKVIRPLTHPPSPIISDSIFTSINEPLHSKKGVSNAPNQNYLLLDDEAP